MKALQNFVDKFRTGISVKKLCEKAYWHMEAEGHDVCLLNERYIIVDGVGYRFSKCKGNWIVKEF